MQSDYLNGLPPISRGYEQDSSDFQNSRDTYKFSF